MNDREWRQRIDVVTQKIVNALHPQKIVLFGSSVWGTPDRDSDIDLLIIAETSLRRFADRYAAVARLVDDGCPGSPVEPFLFTPQEEAALRNSTFFREALERGQVIYERG